MLCVALIGSEARADDHIVAAAPDARLAELRAQVERAEFQAAEPALRALLAEPLDARTHNAALELKAVLALAARKDAEAQQALAELYARDPGHVATLSDIGPQVAAAFERAARSRPAALPVSVSAAVAQHADGRPRLVITLEDGAGAVADVHAFVRYAPEPLYTELVAASAAELAPSIPEPPATQGTLSTYLEARAPSGAVLARAGDATAPLELGVRALDRSVPCPPVARPEPLRRRWWLWTSVSIVAAGIITGSALAAR